MMMMMRRRRRRRREDNRIEEDEEDEDIIKGVAHNGQGKLGECSTTVYVVVSHLAQRILPTVWSHCTHTCRVGVKLCYKCKR